MPRLHAAATVVTAVVTLATLATLTTAVIAPSTSFACCADVDTLRIVGWSSDGEVLVERATSSECDEQKTAEVIGADGTRSRFDLFAHGRRLRDGQLGRTFSGDELWEMMEADDAEGTVVERYPVPASLRRAFDHHPRVIDGDDVLVRATANPDDAPDIDHWQRTVRLEVSIASSVGSVAILSGLVMPRSAAAELSVLVYPAPDGRRAIVLMHLDDPDVVNDELHWVALPHGSASTLTSRMSDDPDAVHSAVPVPTFDLENGGDVDDTDVAWLRKDASRAQAELAASHDDEATESAATMVLWTTRALLWARPADADARAAHAHALERLGFTRTASLVRQSEITGESAHDNAEASVASMVCEDGGCYPTTPSAGDDAVSLGPSAQVASCDNVGSEATTAALLPFGLTALALGIRRPRRKD